MIFNNQDIFFPKLPEHLNAPLISSLLPWFYHYGPLVLFPSSGTSRISGYRWVVQKQENYYQQLQLGIQALQIKKKSRWGLFLPSYHVGGFSVIARAWETQGELITFSNEKWDPLEAYNFLVKEKINYLSLVPHQIFDWVKLKLLSPNDVELVLIGGARLEPSLLIEIQKLGWPIVLSYGMTETNAFFAYKDFRPYFICKNNQIYNFSYSEKNSTKFDHFLEEIPYNLLPSYEFKTENESLYLRSPLLFLGYWEEHQLYPIILDNEGFWLASDLVKTKNNMIFDVLGRRDHDYFKSSGYGYSVVKIKQMIEEFVQNNGDHSIRFEIVLCPCPKKEHQAVLVHTGFTELMIVELIKKLRSVYPFLKLKFLYQEYENWPKTPLGKIHLTQLKHSICQRL